MVFEAIGGAVIGGLGGLSSAFMASAESKKARKWAERMSSTAWQRGIKDMRLAGVNPALAYSQGGASTPGAVQPSIPDLSAGMARGAKSSLVKQERAVMASAEHKNNMEAQRAFSTSKLANAQSDILLPQQIQARSRSRWHDSPLGQKFDYWYPAASALGTSAKNLSGMLSQWLPGVGTAKAAARLLKPKFSTSTTRDAGGQVIQSIDRVTR